MAPVDAPELELIFDGPDDAERRLALAHGAGAPMDSEFMNRIAEGLAGEGVRVARFEFPYMRARRAGTSRRGPDRAPALEATWAEVVGRLGTDWAIGGKSMGGRIATRVADELEVRAVVCLGYPFHPAGKPERLRVAHLKSLRTPTLVVQGTRDTLGSESDVAGYELSDAIRMAWMPDGDHSLKPRVRSGYTLDDHLASAVRQIADFLAIV